MIRIQTSSSFSVLANRKHPYKNYEPHTQPTLPQFGDADLWVNLGGICGALALYSLGHWLASCFNQADRQVDSQNEDVIGPNRQ